MTARFEGVGRVAGRKLAYVVWSDGRVEEFTLSAFRGRFGASALTLPTGSTVRSSVVHETRGPRLTLIPVGSRVLLPESGWTGVVVRHIPGSTEDRRFGPSYLVQWDRSGVEGHVRPGRLRVIAGATTRLTDTQQDVLRLIAEGRPLGDYVPRYRPGARRGRGALPTTIAARAASQLASMGLIERGPRGEYVITRAGRGAL